MASSGSNRRRRPGAWSSWLSVVFGVLAVAALPAAVAVSRSSARFDLLEAAWAIPVAAALAVVCLLLARRARRQVRFTLLRGRRAAAGAGRTLGLLALCLAIAATISVGFYRLLVEFQ